MKNLTLFNIFLVLMFVVPLQDEVAGNVYLPLVINNSPILVTAGISGQVTLNGSPAGGVPLELRFYDGSNWSTRATTTTEADGKYNFTTVPSLANGQKYYVLYSNQSDPSRLFDWGTPELTSYTEGEAVTFENFDIANIELVSPDSGATVGVPATFQWVPRPASPSDSYEFDLFDQTNDEPYFFTDPPLGYVNTYTLNELPAGFNPGTEYLWSIWVYSPDGGSGSAYWSHYVTFSSAITGSGSSQHHLPAREAYAAQEDANRKMYEQASRR